MFGGFLSSVFPSGSKTIDYLNWENWVKDMPLFVFLLSVCLRSLCRYIVSKLEDYVCNIFFDFHSSYDWYIKRATAIAIKLVFIVRCDSPALCHCRPYFGTNITLTYANFKYTFNKWTLNWSVCLFKVDSIVLRYWDY